MKFDKLHNAMTEIDDKYIEEAHTENKKKITFSIDLAFAKKMAVGFACVVLAVAILPGMLNSGHKNVAYDSSEIYDYNTAPGYMPDFDNKETAANGNGLLNEDEALNMSEKLIVTANMKLETMDLDPVLDALLTKVKEYGGYVQSSYLSNYTYGRSYEATIRIPAERYGEFAEGVKTTGNCISYTEDVDDITTQYYSVSARLDSLKAEEQQVMQFYAKAENITELLEIEQRLTAIRSEINSLEATVQSWDLLTAYSTLNIRITETKVYTEVEQNFSQRFINALSNGWHSFVWNVQEFILDITYSIWSILSLALIGVLGYFGYRKFKNRKK